MIFVLLAIAATTIINILIKVYGLRGANIQVVLASNYVTAGLLGWGWLLGRGIDGIASTTLLLGLVGGLLWPAAFYLQMWGVREYGLSLAGTVSRLSLSLPVLFAVLVLGETPTPVTWLGIAGCFVAFSLLAPIQSGPKQALDRLALGYFGLLVIIFGLVDLWVNLFNTMGQPDEQILFLTLIFTVSGLLAWGTVMAQRIPVDRGSFLRGLLLGVPNFGTTWFFLQGLKSPFFANRSTVAYALFSLVPATLIFAMGPVIWRERVTRINWIGLGVGLTSIFMLTWPSG